MPTKNKVAKTTKSVTRREAVTKAPVAKKTTDEVVKAEAKKPEAVQCTHNNLVALRDGTYCVKCDAKVG